MKDSGFTIALAGEDEIRVTVERKRDGKKRTLPVWFAVEGKNLELLPMYGLKTRWFQDVERRGFLDIQAKNEKRRSAPRIVREAAAVERIKRRFGQKYGKGEVRKYYPTSEVALEITL